VGTKKYDRYYLDSLHKLRLDSKVVVVSSKGIQKQGSSNNKEASSKVIINNKGV